MAKVTIIVEDGTVTGSGSDMPLYEIEGRTGAIGTVKASLDSIRWELGPGSAQWPEWDTASELEVVAKFQELVGNLTKVE